MFLVCHMISQNHVIIWSFYFMGKKQLRQVIILPSFVIIDIAVVEIYTAQEMKFTVKDFFSIYDQSCRKLQIWSHLLKKSLMENFIFCVVMMVLVSHMVLQEHVIKGWSNIMGRSPSWKVSSLPNFVTIGTVVVEMQ